MRTPRRPASTVTLKVWSAGLRWPTAPGDPSQGAGAHRHMVAAFHVCPSHSTLGLPRTSVFIRPLEGACWGIRGPCPHFVSFPQGWSGQGEANRPFVGWWRNTAPSTPIVWHQGKGNLQGSARGSVPSVGWAWSPGPSSLLVRRFRNTQFQGTEGKKLGACFGKLGRVPPLLPLVQLPTFPTGPHGPASPAETCCVTSKWGACSPPGQLSG